MVHRGRRRSRVHDGSRPINPASNAKIPTAAAALLLLGPQHRFSTGLFGKVEGGTVAELVLRGRGDPGFSTSHLRDLVRELRTRGVTKVEKILIDQSAFSEWLPPAFEQQPNEWAPFRAPVAAVSVNRNVVSRFVRPGATETDLAIVVADPPGFVISGQIRTAGRGAPESSSPICRPGRPSTAARRRCAPGQRARAHLSAVDDPRVLSTRCALCCAGIPAGDGVRVGESTESGRLPA
jgi:D-alanyl-D-alanine carboxypeptidase/D-alanyl-D-alanine-endopeptidase (penicillin-binding protein 4)